MLGVVSGHLRSVSIYLVWSKLLQSGTVCRSQRNKAWLNVFFQMLPVCCFSFELLVFPSVPGLFHFHFQAQRRNTEKQRRSKFCPQFQNKQVNVCHKYRNGWKDIINQSQTKRLPGTWLPYFSHAWMLSSSAGRWRSLTSNNPRSRWTVFLPGCVYLPEICHFILDTLSVCVFKVQWKWQSVNYK